MSNYYVWLNEKESGPFKADDVLEMVAAGAAAKEVPCRREGGQWLTIEEFWNVMADEKEEAQRPKVEAAPVSEAMAPAPSVGVSMGDDVAKGLDTKADISTTVAKLCLAFGLFIGFLALLSSTPTETNTCLVLAGSLWGTAIWLFLFGQLIHIRAGLARLNK